MATTYQNKFNSFLRQTVTRWHLDVFWRWWMRELTNIVPTRLLEIYWRRKQLPVTQFKEGQLIVSLPKLERWQTFATIDLDESDIASLAVKVKHELVKLPRQDEHGTPLALSLNKESYLYKSLRLPLAVEENLRQTLAFEMDRLTPFKADQVYFDYRVVKREIAAKQLHCDLVVALQATVDPIRQKLESWGAKVHAIHADLALPSANQFNLISLPRQTSRWMRWQVLLPVACLAGLIVFAVGLPIWQKREYAISLHPLVAQAKQAADATVALQQQLEKAQAEYNFLLNKKHAYPSTLQVVNEVAKLLPDDTWLRQLELKAEVKVDLKTSSKIRELQIQGEAGAGTQPSKIIELIEASSLLRQASFKAGLVKGQAGAGENFHIAAEVKPSPPINLAAAAAEAITEPIKDTPSATSPNLIPAEKNSEPVKSNSKALEQDMPALKTKS